LEGGILKSRSIHSLRKDLKRGSKKIKKGVSMINRKNCIESLKEMKNKLICGDNLEALKTIKSESVDLIYIDPPFFSNKNYEVIWGALY